MMCVKVAGSARLGIGSAVGVERIISLLKRRLKRGDYLGEI
jgi:histidyl-tRNA synthetase